MAAKQKKSSMDAVNGSNPKSAKQGAKMSETEVDFLKVEVASFASSLGLVSAEFPSTNSGFNDADFRKSGPLNTTRQPKNPKVNRSQSLGNIKATDPKKNGSKIVEYSKAPKEKGFHRQENKKLGQGPLRGQGPLNVTEGPLNSPKQSKNPKANRSPNLGNIKAKEPEKNAGSKIVEYNKAPKGKVFHRQENKKLGQGPSRGQVPLNLVEESDGRIGGAAKNLPKLPLMRPSLLSSPWYADLAGVEPKVIGKEAKLAANLSTEAWEALVKKKSQRAQQLMEQYVSEYEEAKEKCGNMRMVSMAQKSGTTADKVAAITVLVQDNPLANLKALDTVLAMVTSKVGKRHAAVGIDALKELFVISLLPDRKLKYLAQQPLHALSESKDGNSLLLFWYWEDSLKHRFERFVVALDDASKDTLPFLKDKAVKTMFDLLKNKPEQERKLLSTLVNKLGDPERKVASNAGYHLSLLLTVHPNMKAVVIEEVDMFIFRPNVGLRARYHAVVFLNQILLSSKGDGPKLARRLVDIYFALFEVLISKDNELDKDFKNHKGSKDKQKNILNKKKKQESLTEAPVEIDSRLLSALLTGVNRAFPYVSTSEADDIIQKQTPVLFKLVHSKNFNIGVQALMLLYQLLAKNQTVSDRFFRALYSTLLTPALVRSSKTEMFIGLMFKVLKTDVNLKRIAAFSKRLLQVALQQPPQFACACLFLLSEVLKTRPVLWSTVLQPEDDDEDFEHFEDVMEEGDQRSGNDQNMNSQTIESSEPVSIHSITEDGDRSDNDSEDGQISGHSSDSEDDNSSEHEDLFGDVMNTSLDSKVLNLNERKAHASIQSDGSGKGNAWPRPGYYDPRMREPAYCNADRACWWELTALASHFHPSVAKMAQTLLLGANIVYNGDPINDMSLTAFLDKFVEKKPKASKRTDGEWHGGSQIAPAKKVDIVPPLVGPDLLSLAEEEVPPEDVVFHKFYMVKTTSSKRKPKKKKEADVGSEATRDLVGEDDVEDDFAGGDESDNEEIDDLIDQDGDLDAQPQSDVEYDYEKLNDMVEQEEDALLADDSDGEMDIVEDISEDIDTLDEDSDFDSNVPIFAGKMKGKKRKTSEKTGQSPFASIEDYKHLLDASENGNKNCETRRSQRSGKKVKRSH